MSKPLNDISPLDMVDDDGVISVSTINKGLQDINPNSAQPLSMSDEKSAKDAIALIRKKVALRLDGQKLALANQMIEGISMRISTINDPLINQKVEESIETAQDLLCLTNATEKQIKIMQQLLRVDSVDGSGTSARLAVAFENENGTSFKGLLEFDGG